MNTAETYSTGRPRGRTEHVTATLDERERAEDTVRELVYQAGFQNHGTTDPRAVEQPDGTTIQLPGRARFINRDRIRVTVGRDTTYFYTVSDGTWEVNSIAVHKTLDINGIKKTLSKLGGGR